MPVLLSPKQSAPRSVRRLCRPWRGAIPAPATFSPPAKRIAREEPAKNPNLPDPSSHRKLINLPIRPVRPSKSALHGHHRRQGSGKDVNGAVLSDSEGSPPGSFCESVSNDTIHFDFSASPSTANSHVQPEANCAVQRNQTGFQNPENVEIRNLTRFIQIPSRRSLTLHSTPFASLPLPFIARAPSFLFAPNRSRAFSNASLTKLLLPITAPSVK